MAVRYIERTGGTKKKVTKKDEDIDGGGGEEIKLIHHHLFNILCFQYRIYTVPEFLDEVDPYEVDDVLDCIPYYDRVGWEQTRLKATIQANCFASEPLSPEDIMHFQWDDIKDKKDKKTINKEDIERLKARAKKIQQTQWGIV